MRITFLMLAGALAFGQSKLPPAANKRVDFEKDVQPLLEQKCYSCHGDEVQQSGLRLDKRQNALRGGDYGPVIIPGDSAASKLIRRLVNGDGGLQMPPTGALSNDEIGMLRAWIDQGAEFRIQVHDDDAPKPADPKLASLIDAVRSRDIEGVKKAIATNPPLVNEHDNAGSTPLHHAAGFGSLEIMRFLLDHGADVNAVNKRKSTPLFWSLNDEAKVRLLVDRGADVNAKLIDGRSAAYLAASMGNALPVLRLLLDKGADPNARTLTGMTPLIAACRNNIDVARLLIERKADVMALNAAGGTALMAAAQTGRSELVKLLLDKGADPNAATKRNETALTEAATAGNEETVRLLIEKGAKVNIQDIRGYSPLLYAAGSDTMPAGVVKLLLAKGADRSMKGDGETAAMLAAKRGDTEVARLLDVQPQAKQASVIRAANTAGKERTIAAAVTPALALLAKQSHNFIRIGGCNSCHAQDLPSTANGIAREHGLPAEKEIPQLPLSMHTQNPERVMDLGPVTVSSAGWEMFDLGTNGAPRDEYTDANVHYMKAMQTADGSWVALESRRPPMSMGTHQATALAVYTLKIFGPPAEKADTDRVIARAAAWLESAKPTTTQDRAFHLLGLVWSNAKPTAIAAAAKALSRQQRADGGWNQLPAMTSDAYATGQVLYALSTGHMLASDPVYMRGVKYLLDTQAGDGSWHVASRSIWLQPYFESGFPYGHDQWISAAGTAWATIALSMTVGPQGTQLAAK